MSWKSIAKNCKGRDRILKITFYNPSCYFALLNATADIRYSVSIRREQF